VQGKKRSNLLFSQAEIAPKCWQHVGISEEVFELQGVLFKETIMHVQ
jgi:hypothetical protein